MLSAWNAFLKSSSILLVPNADYDRVGVLCWRLPQRQSWWWTFSAMLSPQSNEHCRFNNRLLNGRQDRGMDAIQERRRLMVLQKYDRAISECAQPWWPPEHRYSQSVTATLLARILVRLRQLFCIFHHFNPFFIHSIEISELWSLSTLQDHNTVPRETLSGGCWAAYSQAAFVWRYCILQVLEFDTTLHFLKVFLISLPYL